MSGDQTLKAVMLLVDTLNERQREILRQRLRATTKPANGDLTQIVADVVTGEPRIWPMEDIRAAVEQRAPGHEPKQLYNSLSYLAKRGHLRRFGQGQYGVHHANS